MEIQNCEYLAILTLKKTVFRGYRPIILTDPRKVVLVYAIGSFFDITTHPQLSPIFMVNMVGSRWAPILSILSDFGFFTATEAFFEIFL